MPSQDLGECRARKLEAVFVVVAGAARRVFVHVEIGPPPRSLVGLDDERARLLVVRVSVNLEDAVLGRDDVDVNASKTKSVPSHMYLLVRKSISGFSVSESSLRIRLFAPSAAMTRS